MRIALAEAIVAENLVKIYPNNKKALNSFSLTVPRGAVYSLLGKNGAGKTTFTKIIATILRPTSGEASVLGFDLKKQSHEIRRRVSIVPQESRPFSLQTPYEHILMFLIARGWSLSDARKRSREVLERLELTEYQNQICSTLSGGLKQRVVIAMASAAEPDLLLLDEPTIGLDPVARLMIWDFIRELVEQGTTIFLTTHYMDEAENLSDRVTIMDRGMKVLEGTPSELKRHLGETTSVTVTGRIGAEELAGYGKYYQNGSASRVFTSESRARELADYCVSKQLAVTLRPVTLEDLFIYLLGEAND